MKYRKQLVHVFFYRDFEVASYPDFLKLPILSCTLVFLGFIYDPAYIRREHFRNVFHFANLKDVYFRLVRSLGHRRNFDFTRRIESQAIGLATFSLSRARDKTKKSFI